MKVTGHRLWGFEINYNEKQQAVPTCFVFELIGMVHLQSFIITSDDDHVWLCLALCCN